MIHVHAVSIQRRVFWEPPQGTPYSKRYVEFELGVAEADTTHFEWREGMSSRCDCPYLVYQHFWRDHSDWWDFNEEFILFNTFRNTFSYVVDMYEKCHKRDSKVRSIHQFRYH